MNTFRVCTIATLLGLGWATWAAQAADVAPAKQTLALPLNLAGRPAGGVQCVVAVGPKSTVSALAFSPDGKTLATGGYREVLLWDLAGAKLAQRIAATGQVGAVRFLSDGRLVIGEGLPQRAGALRIVELPSGQELFRSEDLKDIVWSVAVSPDGKLLAAGGAFDQVPVWNLEQKKLVATLHGHTGWVWAVAFSPDGKLLATGGADSAAHLWDTATWQTSVNFSEAEAVRAALFHPDGNQVVLAVGGPSIWGLRVRKIDNPPARRPIGTGAGMPLGLAGPTKAKRIYVSCSDKTIKVFSVEGQQVTALTGHQDWVHGLAVSADEKLLASGSADGTIKLWSTDDHRLLATLVQTAPRADEWLILTPQGFVSTSVPAALAWKADKLETPADQVTAQLQNAETVAKILAGEKITAPTVK